MNAAVVIAASQAADSPSGILDRTDPAFRSLIMRAEHRDGPVQHVATEIGQITNLDSTISHIHQKTVRSNRTG